MNYEVFNDFVLLCTGPYIQSVTYEAGLLEYEDFPRTEETVYVLGTKNSALYGMLHA